jgi:23S rRNA (cytosine1962-C5)-methyltransferase
MMSERIYPAVTVDDRCEARVRAGHVWVYESDVKECAVTPDNGALCDVFSRRGRYLGTGFYNAASKIRVRMLSTNANDRFDDLFWERRVRYAIEYRRSVMASAEDFLCCRLIFGEADQFPGLTVDRFGDVLVTETLSLGIELRKDVIFSALVRVLAEMGVPVRAIYERNNVAIRKLEGMEETVGFYHCEGLDEHPSMTEAMICENGITYHVDFMHGQKTGFFLDQKYNRLAAAKLARGRTVLDCFTHTGSFALNAAKAGAEHVTASDISEFALEQAKRNAGKNGLAGRMDFVCSDVFELLENLRNRPKTYNMIILDPPAFTKSRRTFSAARSGYLKINAAAMRLLPRGGYLASASCSHFMPNAEFREMLKEASVLAGVSVRIVEERHAAMDHPVLISVPETEYLKFYILQIV